MIVVLVAILSLINAANAGYVTNIDNDTNTPQMMTANASFNMSMTKRIR